jgi:hypothetical protein
MSPAPIHQPDGMTTQFPSDVERAGDTSSWRLYRQNHRTPGLQVRNVGCGWNVAFDGACVTVLRMNSLSAGLSARWDLLNALSFKAVYSLCS